MYTMHTRVSDTNIYVYSLNPMESRMALRAIIIIILRLQLLRIYVCVCVCVCVCYNFSYKKRSAFAKQFCQRLWLQ